MKVLKFSDKATISKCEDQLKVQDGAVTDEVEDILDRVEDLESLISRSQVIPFKKDLLQEVRKVKNSISGLKRIAEKSDRTEID